MQQFVDQLARESVRATHRTRSCGYTTTSVVSVMGAMLVLLLTSLSFAGSASAEEGERIARPVSGAAAQLLVQDTISRVLAAVSRDRERISDQPDAAMAIVEEIVMPSVDLERISQLVLGKHWRAATLTQRERFKREFGIQLLRSYAIGVIDYLMLSEKLGTEISYLPLMVNGDKSLATVRTKVGRSAVQVRIDYRLHRRDESWKVYDVLVGGVSTVRTYRTSFIRETSRNGIDSLTDQIAAKNRQYQPV